MRTEAFEQWLGKIPDLTRAQRQQAVESLAQASPLGEVIAAIADPQRRCPYCDHAPCGHWGQAHGLARDRCGACGKTFNDLAGTPLAHLRHREQWPQSAQALIDGSSVRKAARRCGVRKNTSFRWRHRFLTRPASSKPLHLRGIAEADETYFPESFKGQRHLPRPARKRGGVASKRGLSAERIPASIVRDRSRTTADAVLPKATAACLGTALAPILDPDAVLCSDGAAIYRAFATQAKIAHQPIRLSAGIRVVDHAFHIQNVNAYDRRLKGWMARFYGVATKYLPNYLGWRRCLERFGEALTPEILLGQAVGRGSSP